MSAEVDYMLLEWMYTPADFFEQALTIERAAYTLQIDDGKVEVKLDSEDYEYTKRRGQAINDELHHLFLGAQLTNTRPFQLSSEPAISKVFRDGKRIVYASVHLTATLRFSAGDLVICDRHGQIVTDTKAERIQQRKELAELVARYIPEFPELRQIIERYKLALENPAEEFIYLYEVREAVKKAIGGEQQTCARLNISQARWSDFGQLTNNAPVRQGRHRGVHLDHLRDATEQEIKQARAFAADLIVRYIKYRAGLDFNAGE